MSIPEPDTKTNITLDLEQVLQKCISFLSEIGLFVKYRKLVPGTLLPGISIEEGCIIIDAEALVYPGDILHEAGHIAVVPFAERASLNEVVIGKREHRGAEEMMAIAWSYAACLHVGLDPSFVFHDNGYRGGGAFIVENFSRKNYFGLPMLQWKGMAADDKNTANLNVQPFPKMIKWVLD